jgi:hypothetical protein
VRKHYRELCGNQSTPAQFSWFFDKQRRVKEHGKKHFERFVHQGPE